MARNSALPISRTIREQITGQLRNEVLAGTLVPGAVLRETELAERFGVSRGPIRDAFLQLSNEGYLAYVPNRGVTVRHPPDDVDRDFIANLRRQIEVHIIRKTPRTELTPSAIERVQAALGELEVACVAGDRAAVKRSDLDFHEAVLVACGGEMLIPAWKQLCSRMVMAYDRLGSLECVFEEHRRIAKALETEDPAALEAALQENIR